MLSVITPVLNGIEYIEETIKSVKGLQIPFEHIVVDGGSTDGTLDLLQRHPWIKVINQTGNTGMYGAIHEGIINSNGSFLAYLNADDHYLPGIEKLYHIILRTNSDLIYGNTYHYYIQSKKMKKVYAAFRCGRFFLRQGIMPFSQSSSIFSREAYLKAEGFRFHDFKVCGDLDLFQRIALLKKSRIIFCPIFSSVFLKTGNSLGDQSADQYRLECPKLLNNNGQKIRIRFLLKIQIWLSRLFCIF
jgi:glycosyltransferase involved in cell wall biosynthesis